MVSIHEISREAETKYKFVAPDGGWGYFITASVTIMNLVSIVPQGAFGLIFGNFLASIGDETTGTTLVNGVFNTVQSFTGLASNFLLQKYSYRQVGLLGASLFSVGAFSLVFITNLTHMTITFGVLEGLGFGLMTPATLSAFNSYFNKRLNLMMGIAQAIMVLASILFPPVITLLTEYCGFRGTVAVLAALSLLNFPAMGVLHPVKRHMKKITMENSINNYNEIHVMKSKSLNEEFLRAQIKPLLSKKLQEGILINNSNFSLNSPPKVTEYLAPKPRFSVINLGDRAASLTFMNDLENEGKQIISSPICMDLSLLKDFKYLNISLGVSLSFTSDVAFISIIPLILNNIGFSTTNIALTMMVYFGSDLISRILMSIISAVWRIKNRYIFLAGSFLSAVFRIAFVMNDDYAWKMTTLAILGFLRCLIQTPLSLVFSEEYSDNFPTAFSLYMAVCGFISIIIGLLMSAVKSFTHSDIMVVHVLTAAFLISSVSWTGELAWNKIKTRKT